MISCTILITLTLTLYKYSNYSIVQSKLKLLRVKVGAIYPRCM